MGVVHDGGHRLVGVGVDLHPAGDPGLHQTHIDVPLGDVQPLADGDGGQCVLHVEQPRHGQPELPQKAAGLYPEQDVVAPLPDLGGVDVGLLILLGEGVDRLAAGPGGLQHPVGVVAVQIDAADPGLGENAELGGEVVLKVRVLDGRNVVLADVQKAGGGEVGAQGAVVLQSLAGHLHGQVLHPRGNSVGEVALEVQRLGGGEVGLELLHPVVGVDGGDHAGGGLPLPFHVLVQNILQVVGGGGLALGAGDADDLQLSRGVVIEQVGQRSDGQAHVRHQNAGQVHLGIGGQADIGHGAFVLGHLQKLSLEVGALAEKQGAGDHLPGVVGHQSHRGRPVQ